MRVFKSFKNPPATHINALNDNLYLSAILTMNNVDNECAIIIVFLSILFKIVLNILSHFSKVISFKSGKCGATISLTFDFSARSIMLGNQHYSK